MQSEERKKELYSLIGEDPSLVRIVDEMVELESRLDCVRELPFIKVHPKDLAKQKATPAAKLYKELLQQYTNIIRILLRATGTDLEDDDSPLRKWMNERLTDSL